jgi:hypothetical protein
MNPHEEQRLRDLLDSAVSDVEPKHGLDAIQSRTKVRTMSNRPWIYGVGAAVVATAATIAAFAVLDDDVTTTDSPDPAGSPTVAASSPTQTPSSPDATAEETPAELQTVPVYYVGETGQGPRLFREFHKVRADRDAATEAVSSAVGVEPTDNDYGSPWFGTSVVADSVVHEGGTITVDLATDAPVRGRPGDMTEEEAAMAVEQVLYTAQAALQSRDPVQILVNGNRTDQVFGVPTSEPLAQGDEASTLAQVWIIEPAEGARVPSGFEVSGVGAFFEANVVWELRQGGKVVESGFTTAEECCRMAPYSFPLPDVPAGDYLLVVKDQDMSEGEGFPPFEDTKNITIS